MSAQRNLVGNYRGAGTFRAQAAQKTGCAAQNTPLPPRCEHCRLPGTITIKREDVAYFYCGSHVELGE